VFSFFSSISSCGHGRMEAYLIFWFYLGFWKHFSEGASFACIASVLFSFFLFLHHDILERNGWEYLFIKEIQGASLNFLSKTYILGIYTSLLRGTSRVDMNGLG